MLVEKYKAAANEYYPGALKILRGEHGTSKG